MTVHKKQNMERKCRVFFMVKTAVGLMPAILIVLIHRVAFAQLICTGLY